MSTYIGFKNLIESCTLSGSDPYQAGYELNNVKDRILGRYAKTNAFTVPFGSTSTVITISLPSIYSLWAVLGFINTNLKPAQQYKIETASDIGFSADYFSSGWITLPIDNPNPSQQKQNLFYVAPEGARHQFIRVSISGIMNGHFLKVGRIFVGEAIKFKQGISRGAELGYQNETIVQESLGGVEYFDEKPFRRKITFAIDYINNFDAYTMAVRLDEECGISKEVLLIADDGEVTFSNQRNFLGRFSQLSPIKTPYLNFNQKTFEILEIV